MSISFSSISSQIASNVFSKVDTSNKGYINKDDFMSALGDSSASDSKDSFAMLDSDSNGQLTESEMTKGIQNLLSQLSGSTTQGQERMGPPPPPPPPPNGGGQTQANANDDGLTIDQLSELANSEDSKQSALASAISANFEAADTNSDGKVTAQEAMTYQRSTETSQSTSTQTQNDLTKVAMANLSALIEAYGFGGNANSTISATA
jgi:Ca2+-binding EF-hand superfamily protein